MVFKQRGSHDPSCTCGVIAQAKHCALFEHLFLAEAHIARCVQYNARHQSATQAEISEPDGIGFAQERLPQFIEEQVSLLHQPANCLAN